MSFNILKLLLTAIKSSSEDKTNVEKDMFGLKDSYDSIIPLKLFLSWHTKRLPPNMRENVNQLQELNPEFSVYLFDDNDCFDFIKAHFDKSVINAFESLVPGQYKCDLWRYCVLYIHGGIYMDIKMKCVNGFKLIALTEKEHFVQELDIIDYGVYNSLLICKPGNDMLMKCIHQIVKNVEKREYGYHPLCPTGSIMIADLCKDHPSIVENTDMNLSMAFLNPNRNYIMYENIPVIKCQYDNYRKEQKKYKKTPSHSELWILKKIYKDEKYIIPV